MTSSMLAPNLDQGRNAASWHAVWTLGVGLGAALILTSFGFAPSAALSALAFGALPGVAGWFLRPSQGHGVYLLIVWAAACAFAMALTGGVTGPLMVWGLAPVLAAGAMGGLWLDGATLSFAAFTGVALIQAGGKAGPPPTGAPAFVLGLVALATSLIGAVTALRILVAQHVQPAGPSPSQFATSELEARLAEAEAARDGAQADAQAKMRFLANMSHELRTPLNAIMGFSDIMRARLFGELSTKYEEYAQLIHESGGHLLDLINDVLDMSKIEADKYSLELEVFDVREAVNAALRIMRAQADDAGVDLRASLPARELDVQADRRAIKQIVLNLVSNALKFTPPHGSVTVTLQETRDALEIVVTDTGVGLAPEDLGRIGQPFEQAGDSERRALGTGLGLALVKAFARLHGGTLAVESQLGEGAAFTVHLPVLAQTVLAQPVLAQPGAKTDALSIVHADAQAPIWPQAAAEA